MKARKIVAALFAGVAFVACPLAAEPFPNWDINQAALQGSSELIESEVSGLRLDVADPNQNDLVRQHEEEARKVLKVDPEVVFNQYVAWEITARTYLAAHWSQYSEYDQMMAIKMAIGAAEQGATHNYDGSPRPGTPHPSYLLLETTLIGRKTGTVDPLNIMTNPSWDK